MEFMQRTRKCGELRAADAGKTVVLNGWVHRIREHGGIVFINLRDRYGIVQVAVDDASPKGLADEAKQLRMEYCVAVEGVVRLRPDNMRNPEMQTGDVELSAQKIQILTKCEVLPFMIDDFDKDGNPLVANEDLRLKYRFLDLRTSRMQRNIAIRHKAALAVRNFMSDEGFYEIETPTFIKSTPEGARDYLVPSRLYPGKFYALPQSPQLYKQLLMVSGFDKYFQLARCYRDEDARGDRQPEFTQIDIEMSFPKRDNVLDVVERMLKSVFKEVMGLDLQTPFRRMPYDDAMRLYGTDKPDLRFEMLMQDADFMADLSDFSLFKEAVAEGGKIKALVVEGQAEGYSRKKIEDLEATAKIYRAKGLAWCKVSDDLEGGISKHFAGKKGEICERLGAKKGDLLLFVADKSAKTACVSLGAVRSKLGKDLNLCNPKEFAFTYIVDFPLFEWNEDEKKWEAAHHMFTMPQAKYHDTLESNPGEVKGDLYDLVLNGYELASGSIRIQDPDLQQRIFDIVGYKKEDAQKKFGFLTGAFKYGAPPHGGIALGFDRLVMLMCGELSIRDVLVFPKNTFAINPMDESPSEVDAAQLKELHLKIDEK